MVYVNFAIHENVKPIFTTYMMIYLFHGTWGISKTQKRKLLLKRSVSTTWLEIFSVSHYETQ